MATTDDSLLKNLRSRIEPLPNNSGSLIKSFADHSQSYVYDQALAIIAFSKAQDHNSARSLLLGLQTLQQKDGSLYFSYYMNGKSPYPEEGDKRYAGALAWVAIAAATYQHEFKSKEFYKFNFSLLSYLKSEMKPVEGHEKAMAIRFSPNDIKTTSWNEKETAALEHNLDLYSAFTQFNFLNPESKWIKEPENLKEFIVSMWDSTRSHFWSGMNLKNGEINKEEIYLDNQTWSILALDNSILKKLPLRDALELNCETLTVRHQGILGFMDSKPTGRNPSSQFVWSEGSIGQIMAMKKLNRESNKEFLCQDKTAAYFLEQVKKMTKVDGGVAYATPTINKDFTTSSSVAGTAWLYFALIDKNPFSLN